MRRSAAAMIGKSIIDVYAPVPSSISRRMAVPDRAHVRSSSVKYVKRSAHAAVNSRKSAGQEMRGGWSSTIPGCAIYGT